MPPVFLRQNIDDSSGRTTYDVIDGKQRLTSIIRFINNEIPAATELENTDFDDPNIAGKYFNELDDLTLSEYKRRFWRYSIPIEYVDTASTKLIDNIFDRLNRNGEPLEGQELRHAKYHSTDLYRLIRELSENAFWKTRLKHVDLARMEDDEIISELLFVLLKEEVLGSTQDIIDSYFSEYANVQIDIQYHKKFIEVTNYMAALELNYDALLITGVSHLYGLWCFSWYCCVNNIPVAVVKEKINALYNELRSGNIRIQHVLDYKKTMLSNTKSKSSRKRRMESLIAFCNI
jgi:hypothetical protein